MLDTLETLAQTVLSIMPYLVERAASYNPDLVSLVSQLRVDKLQGWAEVCCKMVCSCRGRSGGALEVTLRDMHHLFLCSTFRAWMMPMMLLTYISYLHTMVRVDIIWSFQVEQSHTKTISLSWFVCFFLLPSPVICLKQVLKTLYNIRFIYEVSTQSWNMNDVMYN